MGKKKKVAAASTPGLGRALIRQRCQGRGGHQAGAGWLHTSELNNGYEWGCLNLQSLTEQNSLEEFLATAELAGTEFVAEKLNVKIVPAESRTGLPTAEETQKIQELHEQNKQLLCIPRRPIWGKLTSPEMLNQAERDSFLEWRRQLARLEEEEKLLLTPFERNLEFWRQLWRVLERSDVVVQIVDARNPLLFRCQDLERYARELSPEKENLILLNKADLLSEEQRSTWARFFEEEGVKVVFWSALVEERRLAAAASKGAGVAAEEAEEAEGEPGPEAEASSHDGSEPDSLSEEESSCAKDSDVYEDCEEEAAEEEEEAWLTCSEEDEEDDDDEEEEETAEEEEPSGGRRWSRQRWSPRPAAELQKQAGPARNSSRLVPREELLEIFKSAHAGKRKVREGEVTLGMVGYPNVGKSSTINAILGKKKVSVSATPGHTKHFQTLWVAPGLCLCDCPGLVMPSFVSTKAEMVCSGILPIDQMRDHLSPVSLVCQRISRPILEATYGIGLPCPQEGEPPDRSPTSEELLAAYGCMRGFMTDHGQPDQPRSARYILKDYVMGKLPYCHPPPGTDPHRFQLWHRQAGSGQAAQGVAGRGSSREPRKKPFENPVDAAFFHQEDVRALTRGTQSALGHRGSSALPAPLASDGHGKPWKKHGNRNKKEKIRRLTRHLQA